MDKKNSVTSDMEMLSKPQKIGLFAFIIQKLYCHHHYETIEKIERKNPAGEVYHITTFRECVFCGKTKIVQVRPE